MHGYKNGVNAYNNMFKLNKNLLLLPEYLFDNGYYTRGDMLGDAVLSKRGFDKITVHDENAMNSKELLEYHNEIITEVNQEEKPFFIFLQYSKIHTGCVTNVAKKFGDLDEEYFTPNQRKINLVNFSSYMDDAGNYAGGLLKKLRDLSIIDETLVIFFSDHGTSLGERFGEKMYGSFVYDYTIKTFFHFLNPLFPKLKIHNQIRAIDIMPTILNFLGIKQRKDLLKIQGKSLYDFIDYYSKNLFINFFRKAPKDRLAFVETGGLGGHWPSPKTPNVKCIRTSKWKLIHNLNPDTFELYNLEKDKQELNNLAGKGLKIERQLKNIYFK